MSFLEDLWNRLRRDSAATVLREVRVDGFAAVTGAELLALIQTAREFLRHKSVRPGDRCGLIGSNGIRWTALNLAIQAEGAIVVPLNTRQAPAELGMILKDSAPVLVACSAAALADSLAPHASGAAMLLFDDIFQEKCIASPEPPRRLQPQDPVTIIYTSGTSGQPKGVPLTVANVDFMLLCTRSRLDKLMQGHAGVEQVFHYLPCSFAASWITLLTVLGRNAVLTFSTDLQRLSDEIAAVRPHYFLNVPILLERIRARIERQFEERGGLAARIFSSGKQAYFRRRDKQARALDSIRWTIARATVFAAVRRRIGRQLKALICGSAPLAVETQLFFMMLGIPVLQAYGLTETTAICTLDDPGHVVPGRVGTAIPGIQMQLGAGQEIVVRGPHLFPGYWNRPEDTAQVIQDGWFHTGDQGEVDLYGRWRITGRIKNLIVLSSGHNVAPEPLEQSLLRAIPVAEQVLVVGNDRPYLAAIVTGKVDPKAVQPALDALNAGLAHYERIRAFHLQPEPFTVESGLVAGNGKLRRAAILAALAEQIDRLYSAAPQPSTRS